MERSIHVDRASFTDVPGMAASRSGTLGAAGMALAIAMAALGIIGLIYGDVAMVWQRIPIEALQGQRWLAYTLAAIELGTGLGLLVRPLARPAAAALFVYMALWAVLLKLPAVVAMPRMEATWLGFGEIAVILAGAWAIHATLAARTAPLAGIAGVRGARLLFAIALPMIGLSHVVYSAQTVELVPAWLPSPLSWAYLTGAGSIAACAGVLTGVFARLAATAEAAMLSIITLLVWGPKLLAMPIDRTAVTAFAISAAIACGAWTIAQSYRRVGWMDVRSAPWKAPRE